MEIKNFIKIYDEVLPWKTLSNLIRFANDSNFEKTKIGGGNESMTDFNIRRAHTLCLSNLSNFVLFSARFFYIKMKFLHSNFLIFSILYIKKN
jgi:hypothetical protein